MNTRIYNLMVSFLFVFFWQDFKQDFIVFFSSINTFKRNYLIKVHGELNQLFSLFKYSLKKGLRPSYGCISCIMDTENVYLLEGKCNKPHRQKIL